MKESGKIISFLLLAVSFCFTACSGPQPNICIRDNRQYCVTSDKIYVITWDVCYRRGVSCIEGKCWDNAIDEFNEAIRLRYEDQRHVRAYGMHFREEYFPHREMGICYFNLGNIQDAIDELEISLSQTPSARAKYYINRARRADLLSKQLDRLPPVIQFDSLEDEYIIAKTPFGIKGSVSDDYYVAAISVNQKPLFIELAESSMPFTYLVDLKEGWNDIQVTAEDLVGKETDESIRVFLDQQGPMVIVNPVMMNQPGQFFDEALIRAVLYDKSGIVSFELNQKEVQKLGLEQICLIEESIPITRGIDAISFRAEDAAGNITEGQISLFPEQRMRRKLSKRVACNNSDSFSIAMLKEENDFLIDITNPPQRDSITYYDEIFLEGMIETKNGIKKIGLNNKELFNLAEIEAAVDDNMQDLIQMLIRQNKDPDKYIQLLQDVVETYNTYYINQRIPLTDEFTYLDLIVEDSNDNQIREQFSIKKIHREEVFQSEQRMIMALLPFDETAQDKSGTKRYVYNKLIESFFDHNRFNLVEREKLPWILIEKTIQSGGKLYKESVAQETGQMVSADGVVCGYIQKREDGIEILARFIEVDTGIIRLFHDVFSPSDDFKDINLITAGLAMKFRDSFPICTGSITSEKGNTIHIDIGSEKGIFPGMSFNIFKDERELIGKAYIRNVEEGSCEAEIPKTERFQGIKTGYKVRAR